MCLYRLCILLVKFARIIFISYTQFYSNAIVKEFASLKESFSPARRDASESRRYNNGPVKQHGAIAKSAFPKAVIIRDCFHVIQRCGKALRRYGCDITPEEFNHIYRAYSEERTALYQDSWERMRMLATIIIQPYAKKGLTPQKLLSFPWEKKKPEHTKVAPAVSKEDALKRFEKVLGKVGNG